MKQININPQSEETICESCALPFGCGAKSGRCWCFDIAIDADKLAKIQEEFKNCLCPECLEKVFQPSETTALK